MKNKSNRYSIYIPYQPGFEQKVHYQNLIIPKGHPLYGIVLDFYQFESNMLGENKLSVIPDGCIDILFRYSNGYMSKTLEGFHREKLVVPLLEEGCAFGIRFFPGAIADIMPINAREVIARQVHLSDIAEQDDLLDCMEEASDFQERVVIMTKYILKMKKSNYGSGEVVRFCMNRIIDKRGNMPIADLANETGYSLRYLRELYYKYVGISPKELSEIIQFQNSFMKFTLIQEKKIPWSLSNFAMESGYYDQSHMNKNYQKMAGCPPMKLYQEFNKEKS